MGNYIVTPNMQLPNPTPGVDPGPDYANNIQSSLIVIDQHNHTQGSGVFITPAAININADLPFNTNNATLLRSARFAQLGSALVSAVPDQGCLYVALVGSNYELFYNDTSSNQVQLTLTGSVNATSSGITSGNDSAAFSSNVLVVNSSSAGPLNIQAGSLLIGNNSVGSKFITLSPTGTIAADYGLQLPTIPAATSYLSIDTSGNIAASVPVAVNYAISSSCGNFSITTTSFSDITNLSVTITTSGGPVIVFCQSDGTSGGNNGGMFIFEAMGGTQEIGLFRGASLVGQWALPAIGSGASVVLPGGTVYLFDPVSAGTYTYTVKGFNIGTPFESIASYMVLVAYELK